MSILLDRLDHAIHLDRLDHAFHYISQWDPHKSGTTKGGYIQGSIEVPSECARILLTCVPHEENNQNPHDIQPCLLHIVFKESDRKRNKEKEPMPSFDRWRLILEIDGKNVVTKDKHGEDYRVAVVKDGKIVLGDKGDDLNLVILFPKTDTRGENQRQEFIKTILRGKGVAATNDLVEKVNEYFIGDQSVNLHRMRILGDFVNFEDTRISSCRSEVILNNKNKMVGALSFSDAFPLKSCTRGGRKVMMISDFPLSKDVVPRFLVYDKEGNRRPSYEDLLCQPTQFHMQNNCMIKFTTPQQDKINQVLSADLQVKLTGCRDFDGYQSQSQFNFEFLLHPKTGNCWFCDGDPDGSKTNMLEAKTRPTKGCPKRKMTNIRKQSNTLSPQKNSGEKVSWKESSGQTNEISPRNSTPLNSQSISLQTLVDTTVSFGPNTTTAVSYSSDKKSDNISLNKLSDSRLENSIVLQAANDCNNMEIPSTVQNLFTHNQTDALSTDFSITSDDITDLLNMINPPNANVDTVTHANQDTFNLNLAVPNLKLVSKQHDNFGIPLDLSFDSIPMVSDHSHTGPVSFNQNNRAEGGEEKASPDDNMNIMSFIDNSNDVTPYIDNLPSISPQTIFSVSPSCDNNISSVSPTYGDSISFIDNFSLNSSPSSDIVPSISPLYVDTNFSTIPFESDELSSASLYVNDNLSLTSSSLSSSRDQMYPSMISSTSSSSTDEMYPTMITVASSSYTDQTYSSIMSLTSSSSTDQIYSSMMATYVPPSDYSSDDDLSHTQLDGHLSPSSLLFEDIMYDIPKVQFSPLLSSPQLYCLAEILHKLGYVDDDPSETCREIKVEIVVEKSITVLETVGIPFKDRESASNGVSKKREWQDYFPSRRNKTEISTLILHRFDEALDTTISCSLSDSSMEYDPGMMKLSRFLLSHLQRGWMVNYILVNTSRSPILWRVSHPGRTKPQSVGPFNSHCVTAMVQTNRDQELPSQAFDLLMDTICSDLASSSVPPPQYLASYQEIRGGGPEGAICNIKELRRRSRRKHCRENRALF